MLFLYGKRSMIIKKYADHTHACPHCRALNLEVKVEKSYFHLFFIPVFPVNGKFAHISCVSCGNLYKDPVSEEDFYIELEDEYEKRTRSPIYLYSGLILIAALVLFIIVSNRRYQQLKSERIENPQTGDTYLIREKRAGRKYYHFTYAFRVTTDSVFIHPGNLEYLGFVRKMNKRDYFDTTVIRAYAKQQLRQMLEDGMIVSVDREKEK